VGRDKRYNNFIKLQTFGQVCCGDHNAAAEDGAVGGKEVNISAAQFIVQILCLPTGLCDDRHGMMTRFPEFSYALFDFRNFVTVVSKTLYRWLRSMALHRNQLRVGKNALRELNDLQR